MSLSRANLLTYAQNQYAALATETGQATTDTAAGHGPAIDYALRNLGVAQADLATGQADDGEEDEAFLLLDYAALNRFARALATKIDNKVGDIDAKQSQLLGNVNKLLDQARKDLIAAGFGAALYELGRLNLDLLEPVTEF